MLKLHEIQSQFMQGLYAPHMVNAGDFIQARASHSATQSLQAYRQSLIGHLTQALSEIYPVCLRLLGEIFFDKLSLRYIKDHPSSSLNLHDYGLHFADFMHDFPPLVEFPYLPDVARLEWYWHRAFHAQDEEDLQIQALSALKAGDMPFLHFKLPASAHLLASTFPVQQIWAANQPDSPTHSVDLDQGGGSLLIWRHGYDMRIDSLSQEQWLFLSAIEAGESFSSVCERLPQQHPQCNPVQLAPECVAQGFINGFYLNGETS